MNQKVKELSYHRNGISGAGFYVGLVEEVEAGVTREMLVVRFGDHTDKKVGAVVCAAFDLALLDKREFMSNSWCGDHYHEVMDKAIADD